MYRELSNVDKKGIDLNLIFCKLIKNHKYEVIMSIFTFLLFFVIHLRVSIDQMHVADMFRYFQDNTFAQKDGRFVRGFLNVVLTNIDYNYVSYYLYFIISLVFISISFVILLKFLDIEKKILWSFIIILLSSTYECFSSIFWFIYDSPFYFMAFLLSNISLMCIKNHYDKTINIIQFIILNVISLLLYQSFYIYVSAMLIIHLIKCDLVDDVENRLVLKKTLYYMLILFVTFLIYFAISECCYSLIPDGAYIWGKGLPFNHFSIYKVIGCYAKYFGLFLVTYRNINHTVIIKIIYFIITITIVCIVLYNLYVKKKYISFILLMVLPINVSIISFFAYIKPSMMFANLSLYFLWIILLNNYFDNMENNNFNRVFIIISLLSTVLMFSHNLYKTVGSYEYYLDIEKKNINFITRLATKIEMCEGYNVDSYIYINVDGEHEPCLQNKIDYNIIDYFDNAMAGNILQEIDWPYGGLIHSMLSHFAGIKMKLPNSEMIENLKNTEEYRNMGIYPNSNSIKCINEVVVVKLYDN